MALQRQAQACSVQASIPLIAGWKHNALRRVQKPRRRYDAEALEASARTNDTTYQALCSKVEGFLSEAPPDMPLFTINRTVLTFCETTYPLRPVTRAPRPWMTPGVINSLSRMWELHRALKAFGRGRDPSAQACLHAWRYAVAFDRQVKQFRREGKQRRRQVLLDQLSQAQQAANSFSQGKLYRVIRQMAPKTKREKVQIRSEAGALMTVKEEFREIAGHCRQVFGQGAPKQRRALPAPLVLEVEEVKLAIAQLQARKGVPRSSFPTTIWKACAGSLAERLCRVANSHWGQRDLWVPGEWADCELLMIPKPGKVNKRPKDLRPLGLQDPGGKSIAKVLKDRLHPMVSQMLWQTPQFAYVEGKAIDEAISRVASHCKRTRDVLRQGNRTVYDKRKGVAAATCAGGVQLSVDLSQAFDLLPRPVLESALIHAGAEQPLVQALLHLHEQSLYKIEHQGYTTQIPMRRGVRQGCTVAPLLFAVFSSYFYRLLCQRVPASWAAQFITLFADDSHLSWEVRSVADLQFMHRCVLQVFSLLEELGMRVNPEKSAIVVGLRGHAGRQWVRKHLRRVQGREVLDLGLPGKPLLIPKVQQMTYLGVVVSYGSFEKQTLAHRLKVAAMNRQRLQKILHSSRILSVRHRLRLYLTCIRTSATYGLHAVGLTTDVLYRLGVFEVRHVRAIAKSPVHITRESTLELYNRLGVSRPTSYVRQLLERRVQVTQNLEAHRWFCSQLAFLDSAEGTPTVESPPTSTASVIVPVSTAQTISCPTCGIYFPDIRSMRIHHAKEHKISLVNAQQEDVSARRDVDVSEHAVDGMPTCKHCNRTFPTFVVFKKHILNACPVLKGMTQATAPASTQGPTQTSLGQSCRESDAVPMMKRPDIVQFVLNHSWRELLRDRSVCATLKNWCIQCGQWVSDVGSGIKTHMRSTHPDLWLLKKEAEDRTSKAGLVAQSPCKYCGAVVKQPGAHLKHCGPVFHASVLALAVAKEHGDGGRGFSGPARDAGHLSGLRRAFKAGTPRRGQGDRAAGEVLQTEGERRPGKGPMEQELGVRQLGGLVQKQGPTVLGNHGGGSGACQAAGQSGSQAGGRQCAASGGKRVYPVFRHGSTRHFADASGSLPELEGQEGGGKSDDVPPRGPATLRAPGASNEAAECAGGRECEGSGHQAWMAEGRRGGPGSGLDFHEVGSGKPDPSGVGGDSHEALQASGPCGSAAQGVSAGARSDALPLDQAYVRHLPVPGASLLDESGVSLSGSGHGLRCVVGPDRVLGAANDWASPPQGTPGPTAAGEGVDYHLPEFQYLRLEEEGGDHPEAPSSSWERGRQGSVIEEPPRREPTLRAWLCTEETYTCLPTAVLSNTSNVCYMNAVAHCMYWSGVCGPNSSQAYGAASGCLRLLRSSKPQLLHRTLSWRSLLRDWPEVSIQHDAAEFFAYLVARAVPVAWDGEWQSREQRHADVRVLDRGSTFQPVLVPLAGDSLQCCWDAWERQAAIHALWRSGGLLLMQLGRYREAGADVHKDTRAIHVLPGQSVAVPFFDHEEGTIQCSMHPFRVLFVIYHLGNTLTSGHYKAALSTPPSLTGTSQWKFMVCDDNRNPQRASSKDLHEIQHNVYLVGLLKLSVSN